MMNVGEDGGYICGHRQRIHGLVGPCAGTYNKDVDEEVSVDSSRMNVALAPPSDDGSTIDPVDMITSP
ncbi:hypothetical protein [Oryza sativa Japonica Group]|uniref:Uncharacterized protein n=2 Tax=Oryza sativa subsp. japonica TaxID=39947 RepID=Q5VPY7_ORYSJ|nr:hypothetical protein [Oryza sativa Japonica Group]BAD68920.1 hypothetical protein [Oryza sativa Japonica Group]